MPTMILKLALLLFLVGCSIGPDSLRSYHATDLEARKIRRIAVLPPTLTDRAPTPKVPFSTALEPRSSERDAPANVSRFVYLAMVSLPNWQIVSESEVREVGQSLAASGVRNRIEQVGAGVYADAVLTSRVQRYRERIGNEWGAQSPASVAFVLNLVDVRRGDVVWSATFDETQQSLTENIFAIGNIGQRGVRWLSADQLAQDGIKRAIGKLHGIIGRSPPA